MKKQLLLLLAGYILFIVNIQGQTEFSSQKIISDSAEGAKSVYATDLDGDGDDDVLSASSYNDKIAWYENLLYTPTLVNNPSESQQVSVYPNPAKGEFELMLQGIYSEIDVRIYNATGTLLIKKEKQRVIDGTYEETFDFSMYTNGIYYIKIITGKNDIVRKLSISR